jgi:hypothetical protein
MNFSYQRTALQAVGWYLVFSLMGILLGAIAGGILAIGIASFAQGAPTDDELRYLSGFFGKVTIILYQIVLAVALLRRRSKAVLNILLALLAVLLSVALGPLGGLIPVAVLTTRPIQKLPAEIGEVFK